LPVRHHGNGRKACDLAGQCLVGTEQQLLASLASGIKGARNLGASEGSICQQATVLPSERNSLMATVVPTELLVPRTVTGDVAAVARKYLTDARMIKISAGM